MFDSIGWGEIIVLALAALFIFGPERLPDLAKEAAAGLKKVREAITGVRDQVQRVLGDDLAQLRDLDLRKYHPRTFIRSQLLDDDEPPVRPARPPPGRRPPARATGRRRRRSTATPPACRRACPGRTGRRRAVADRPTCGALDATQARSGATCGRGVRPSDMPERPR